MPSETFEIDTSDILAVVDTNVLLDMYSCHDLYCAYEQLGHDDCVSHPTAVFRRARARESLLLAIYLHRRRATTYSLGDEAVDRMLANVDPNAGDAFPTHFTIVFVHFVREQVIPGWKAGQPPVPKGLRGNAADRWLLDYAKENDLPLITNEGYGPNGVEALKLRKRALDAGVRVCTPREFYSGRFTDEEAAARAFIQRFRRRAQEYVDEQEKPEVMARTMEAMDGYFHHILFGETAGQDAPVSVSVEQVG